MRVSDDLDRPEGLAPAGRPVLGRTVLGVLLAVLVLAVLIALWALIVRGNDDVAVNASNDDDAIVVPTPLPIPTSTPVPATVAPELPTPTPAIVATPIPSGFEACGDERAPLRSATYIVDTLSTPLNQRSTPSVDADLAGTFDPGQTGLAFTGECVVNLADGYVWWAINNGTADVWIASRFVTPN